MKSWKAIFVTWTFRFPRKRQLSILLNFFFPFIDIGYFSQVLNLNSVELNCFAKQAKLFLKKPLFQKLWWSCDFPPRKTPVARKHRAISRQEKMAYSTPLSGCLGTPPPPFSESVRAGGRAYAGVTTEISRIDWLPNFLIHGAPQQLQFGQKDLESLNVTHRQLTTQAGYLRTTLYASCPSHPIFYFLPSP